MLKNIKKIAIIIILLLSFTNVDTAAKYNPKVEQEPKIVHMTLTLGETVSLDGDYQYANSCGYNKFDFNNNHSITAIQAGSDIIIGQNGHKKIIYIFTIINNSLDVSYTSKMKIGKRETFDVYNGYKKNGKCNFTATSSNNYVCSVKMKSDTSGIIHSKKAGSTTIKIVDNNSGTEIKFKVTVTRNKITKKVTKIILFEGDTISYELFDGLSKVGNEYNYSINSSNNKICKVNGNTKSSSINLSGLKRGATIITIVDNNSGVKCSIDLQVR